MQCMGLPIFFFNKMKIIFILRLFICFDKFNELKTKKYCMIRISNTKTKFYVSVIHDATQRSVYVTIIKNDTTKVRMLIGLSKFCNGELTKKCERNIEHIDHVVKQLFKAYSLNKSPTQQLLHTRMRGQQKYQLFRVERFSNM